MMTGSRGYMELNKPKQQEEKPSRLFVIAAAATVALAANWMHGNAQKADAQVALYKLSPIVAACDDPRTKQIVAIRQADVQANPNVVAEASKSLSCKPVKLAKKLVI